MTVNDVPPPISYRPASGPPRRVRYLPATEPDVDYYRETQTYTGCGWRTTGREPVTDVLVDGERR